MSARAQTSAAVNDVRRLRRLEPAALAGVISRDVVIFKRYWKATTFSSVVQPTIYLLAFGLGFGTLLKQIGHIKTIEYIATGTVATAVLFSSAFPGMFNTFIRWQFQRTYDAMLAAPVDVEELITAEILWISLRAGVYGMAPLVVGILFGLQPPAADWGLMINENRIGVVIQPWPVVLPVAAIAVLTIGMNLITDGIARAAIGIGRSAP